MGVHEFPSCVNVSFMSLEKTCAQSTINALPSHSAEARWEKLSCPFGGETSSDSHLFESRGNTLLGMIE